MTTVQTRTREIGDKEGFDIIVTRKSSGRVVDPTKNGIMGKYDFEKALKGAKTVSAWRKDRFEKTYPGLSCRVLKGDGEEAKGQSSLSSVRTSYEE